MDSPAIPSPPLSSTTAPESCISSQAPPPTTSPFNLLEISLISAQDLAPISKSMQTYAVAWINSNRKQTTRPDQKGHKNPTWNDKFVFSLDNEEIASENSILTVEIYTVSWFRDVLVGVVKALVSDLTSPLTRARRDQSINTRFVALQVRRPSGNPQGILNMGVTLLENTMRSMPLSMLQNWKHDKQVDDDGGDNNRALDEKIHLWRSLSVGSSDFPLKPGSLCNATENGSELCSDIGPSASVVAAELAEKQLLLPPPPPQNSNPATNHIAQHETGSSILEELTMEEAKAKGYRRERWRKPAAGDGDDVEDDDESELLWEDKNGRRRRRGSDGGLFSCFVYGIEFTIVCGASKNAPRNKSNSSSSSRRKKKNSEASSV